MTVFVFFFFCCYFFFFKQKRAYEIYQCDWSSDVCSSDLSHPNSSDSLSPDVRFKAGDMQYSWRVISI